MTSTGKGWTLFIAALGLMFTLMSNEIADLMTWGDAAAPGFVAKLIGHAGTVIGAFIAGRLIPTKESGT